LLDAFGGESGATLERIRGEDMALGGGPVALGEKGVRNDACQFGPEGERGEAEGISVRRGRHGTALMVSAYTKQTGVHKINCCFAPVRLLLKSFETGKGWV
jgi:hypothetical protein